MLDILDGIIATAAIALGLSLIVQAIQQIIKQMLDLKSTYMRRELLALFGTIDRKQLARWISGGLDAGLVKPVSWISRSAGSQTKKLSDLMSSGLSTFAPSILQERMVDSPARKIVEELSERVKGFGYKDLELLEKIGTDDFKKIVKSLAMFRDKETKKRLGQVMNEVDTWFDLSKKAFQDHYERGMKYWALGISAVVVIVVNANLFDVYKEFANDKPLRDAAVEMGERLVAASADTGDSPSVPRAANAGKTNMVEIRTQIAKIETLLNENTFQAWRWDSVRVAQLTIQNSARDWAVRILGWSGMTLLVSLGAPFWYDFLKAVMGIKGRLKGKEAKTTDGVP